MKVVAHLLEFTSFALLLALVPPNAWAQGMIGGVIQRSAVQSAVNPPSAGPWSANNVAATRPFGNIDISTAGTSNDSVKAWAQGRTTTERIELNGRCRVITNPSNAERYSADAREFCRSYMTVGSANPPPGTPPGTRY